MYFGIRKAISVTITSTHKVGCNCCFLFLFSYYLFLFVVGTGMHPCEPEHTTKSSQKRDVLKALTGLTSWSMTMFNSQSLMDK